ncbi:MAG: hypothetical protein ACRD0I_09010 [Acidimicrobiales bacterium]
MKGVGQIDQLPAIVVFIRWAFVMSVLHPVTATHSNRVPTAFVLTASRCGAATSD